MSESAALERGYRRLLVWYPAAFRREQEEEMLAVLMAGARRGQQRPGLLESADLIRNAVVMRLRLLGSGPEGRTWGDGLSVFSVAAPVSLLLATILEVAVPYHVPSSGRLPVLARFLGRAGRLGGLRLLTIPAFDITLGCQVLIAVLVILGLRWIALAAIAGSIGCWIVGIYRVPELLQVLSVSVFMLAGAALIVSPGPRRGRQLMNWRHGVVLGLVAAAVQVSTLIYDSMFPPVLFLARNSSDTLIYLAVSVVLALAAASLLIVWKMNRFFLLFLAVMFYPYVLQIAFPQHSSDDNLIGLPTPAHLVLLFLPALLLAVGALVSGVIPRRSGQEPSSDPDRPRLT